MNVSNIYLFQMKTNCHTSHDAYKMKIFAMIWELVLLPFGNDGFYNDRHKNNQNNSEKVSKRKKKKNV